ncbi:hypothetical protein ABIB40_001951 [Pedobacter sp. UYP30]
MGKPLIKAERIYDIFEITSRTQKKSRTSVRLLLTIINANYFVIFGEANIRRFGFA